MTRPANIGARSTTSRVLAWQTCCALAAPTNWRGCTRPQRPGARLYLAIDAGPVFAANGDLVAVVETLNDLTEHKHVQIALQNLAIQDGLTGLANRRHFDATLAVEWQRAQRESAPLSIILSDVDHFKRYNDTCGHLQGDECLRAVGKALSLVVSRPADLVARYGGEEFAVILPGIGLTGACHVAERIRDGVLARRIPHAASETFDCVTLSLGVVSVVPAPRLSIATAMGAADHALYQAKHGGRNRVVAADVPGAQA